MKLVAAALLLTGMVAVSASPAPVPDAGSNQASLGPPTNVCIWPEGCGSALRVMVNALNAPNAPPGCSGKTQIYATGLCPSYTIDLSNNWKSVSVSYPTVATFTEIIPGSNTHITNVYTITATPSLAHYHYSDISTGKDGTTTTVTHEL